MLDRLLRQYIPLFHGEGFQNSLNFGCPFSEQIDHIIEVMATDAALTHHTGTAKHADRPLRHPEGSFAAEKCDLCRRYMIDVALVDLLCTVTDPILRFYVAHRIGQTMRHGLIFQDRFIRDDSIAGVIQRFFVSPFRQTDY
jgi:hypothetical protein